MPHSVELDRSNVRLLDELRELALADGVPRGRVRALKTSDMHANETSVVLDLDVPVGSVDKTACE